MLDGLGFSAGFAAQPIPPGGTPDSYPGCWRDSLEWSGHVSPLTMPYRVNRHTILPPLHDEADYLNLVEIPLNMWVDTFRLTLDNQEVSREDMFDRHVTWAGANARRSPSGCMPRWWRVSDSQTALSDSSLRRFSITCGTSRRTPKSILRSARRRTLRRCS
jgi:hypothetical protein